jgi:hypothetical protein
MLAHELTLVEVAQRPVALDSWTFELAAAGWPA